MMYRILCLLILSIHKREVSGIEPDVWTRWIRRGARLEEGRLNDLRTLGGSFSPAGCILQCRHTRGCLFVVTNKAKSKCQLVMHDPPSDTPGPGWEEYTVTDPEEVNGTKAWQSSTYSDCYAEYGIDGRIDICFVYNGSVLTCQCACTNESISSWIMELARPTIVHTVFIYFRTDGSIHRNNNFEIAVHESFEEAKTTTGGNLCTSYAGEALAGASNLTCETPVYGQALRVTHPIYKLDQKLQFCEVKVYGWAP